MPSSQYIHDRLKELDQKSYRVAEAARKAEARAQQAERQNLQAQCAANGHVLTVSGYVFASGPRTCAVCGAVDPAVQATRTLSENMSKP